jgi:integrase/recombinase XerD
MTQDEYTLLIDNFLLHKRKSGYKYTSEEIILRSFTTYLKNYLKTTTITKEFLDEWATQSPFEGRKSLANRVGVIRELCIYLNMHGHEAYIIPAVKNSNNKAYVPYVFSHKEIEKIFDVTDNLKNQRNNGNFHIVYPVLLRVLYGCGLRISEALHLKIEDIDTVSGKIIVKHGKYSKQRVVMMHHELTQIVHAYKRKHLKGKSKSGIFFPNKDGSIRDKSAVGRYFQKILYHAKIPYYGRGKGPYLHNLRHTFTSHSLTQMSENGIDINVGISLLSEYLVPNHT